MILHNLNATFGCFNNTTLELKDGLNVIQAPNESGKSTWLALIRTMLYGFPARERGPLAEKNRYAPWSGAAMKGRMELTADAKDLVIIRDTVQPAAPMGRFYAAYAGTSTQAEGLTGQNAGEVLTGVPRSVFERSAYIRQGSLAVDQDAELERRIVSLISSGDEDTSYIETEKALRSALNRRRHNKTGALPQLEATLTETEDKLRQLYALQQQTAEDRADLLTCENTEAACSAKLALHARMDVIDAKRELLTARAQAAEAQAEAAQLRAEIEADQLPSAEQLMHIKFNSANLLTTQVSMNHVQQQAEEAKKQTAARKAAVDAALFSSMTPEAAAEKVQQDAVQWKKLQKPTAFSLAAAAVLALAALICCSAGLYFQLPPYAYGAAACIAAIAVLVPFRSRKRARERAAALLQFYGAASFDEVDALLIHYNNVYRQWIEQKDAEAQINASWKNLYETYKRLSGEILKETAAFCPDVDNVHAIAPLLDAGLRRWKKLQECTAQADRLHARCEALESTLPDCEPLTAEEENLTRPAEDRDTLRLSQLQSSIRIQELRSRIDRSEGEMAAIGDRDALLAQREQMQAQHEQLQQEYDAIALAMEDLSQANTELQNRFSPALGQRAGEIFNRLTRGRYQSISLDKEMNAAAEREDLIPRQAALLSQGAADQLYLAVRLAICELVLPPEKQLPLILDDALMSFDEERMAAALDFLMAEAEKRQILLFTCHNREAVYLQNRKNVHIITLSENRWR